MIAGMADDLHDLAADVLRAARTRGMSIATAESCTGGMVSAALTAVPGASDVFLLGVASYANTAKETVLNVSQQTLRDHGAVSEPVAGEMARGVARLAGADLSVATTGIAGPGGSDHKPEGRVCFALSFRDQVQSETKEFGAIGRDHVRAAATRHALLMMQSALERHA